jgi:RNA polymerase sigma-70 factor (ECF subfamily)
MEYHLLSDKQLLEECSKDNIKAFSALFDRYFGKLYRYAVGYVSDEYFAEEAMMDLMMWVWDKRHVLKIDGEFRHYIFRAAKNATIKAIRKKAFACSPIEAIENDISFITKSADHDLQTTELDKKVFQMSREDEFTHAEIASSLNISINTVKNHIKFSLNHFRKEFNNYSGTILLIAGFYLFF